MLIVMVGARDRSSVKKSYAAQDESDTTPDLTQDEIAEIQKPDKEFVKGVLTRLKEKFGLKLCVVSFGCDDGIGLIVKAVCEELRIKFAEVTWYFHRKDQTKIDYTKFYIARNATVLEIGDMFYMFMNKRRNSTVEDLFKRILEIKQFKSEDRPYVMYDESCKVIGTNMDQDLIQVAQ